MATPKENLQASCYLADPSILGARLLEHVFGEPGSVTDGLATVVLECGVFELSVLEEAEASEAIGELRALAAETIERPGVRDYVDARIDHVRAVLVIDCEYIPEGEEQVLELLLEVNASVAGLMEIWDEIFDFNGEPLSASVEEADDDDDDDEESEEGEAKG